MYVTSYQPCATLKAYTNASSERTALSLTILSIFLRGLVPDRRRAGVKGRTVLSPALNSADLMARDGVPLGVSLGWDGMGRIREGVLGKGRVGWG